jgi:mRNA interferase RelE/StbE
MIYRLSFLPSALKEWNKLGVPVRDQFKKRLEKRLEDPEVPGDRLRGLDNCYKIKLRSAGYRLVYEVEKKQVRVIVVSVGKREAFSVYRKAQRRKKE